MISRQFVNVILNDPIFFETLVLVRCFRHFRPARLVDAGVSIYSRLLRLLELGHAMGRRAVH